MPCDKSGAVNEPEQRFPTNSTAKKNTTHTQHGRVHTDMIQSNTRTYKTKTDALIYNALNYITSPEEYGSERERERQRMRRTTTFSRSRFDSFPLSSPSRYFISSFSSCSLLSLYFCVFSSGFLLALTHKLTCVRESTCVCVCLCLTQARHAGFHTCPCSPLPSHKL